MSGWTDTQGAGGIAKPSAALWIVAIGGAALLSGVVAVVVLTEPKKIAPARRRR